MNFSAVILAGGKSRRMGRDKAWLPAGGRPLLARQVDMVRQLAPCEIFISARAGAEYEQFGCPVLNDRVADAGPVSGISRALEDTASPLLLVLAVDMPNMEASLLQRLVVGCQEGRGAIPRVNGRIEPLAAFYPKAARNIAEEMLRDVRLVAGEFAASCVASGLAVFHELPDRDAVYFTNWNTPEDVAVLPP